MSIFNRGTTIVVQEGSDLSVQLAIDAELGAREAEAAAAADAIATAADRVQTGLDVIAAEAAADRVDLGALDQAVEDSEAARDKSQEWAEHPENAPVETGKYSALHHAAKAEAAELGAQTAQGLAEAARDAATVNAEVYADTTAGLADTSEGDQFQVVEGDEIIRYRHDAGGVATEVARYPGAGAVAKMVDQITATAGIAALRDIALRRQMEQQAARSAAVSGARTAYAHGQAPDPVKYTGYEAIDVQWSVSGLNLTVRAGRTALHSAGRVIYPSGTVALTAATTGTVTDEARTLSFAGTGRFFQAGDGVLDHARVSNVVVTAVVGSIVLDEGTDYLVDYEQGGVVLAAAGSDLDVTVDYDWSAVRYDLIETDASGAIYVTEGTDRDRDVAEYLPTPTAGRVPLMIARVTDGGVTVWRWFDEEQALLSAPALVQRARARRLPNFQKALRAGAAVTIAGYGDSRTSIGGTTAYTPNGPARDRATLNFLQAHGADFIATIPLYDFGDGAGQVHTKIGWNWSLLAAIEALYPNAVDYLNFGIPSTTSADTLNNGLWPARLAGLTGSGATIATIAFGMNELGDTAVDTTANLVAIAEACIAAGIDPVIVPPTRPNSARSANTLDAWIIEHQQNRAAADYLQIPFVDLLPIIGGDTITGRLDPRDMACSNLYNHDGVFELGLIGRALSRIVLDT